MVFVIYMPSMHCWHICCSHYFRQREDRTKKRKKGGTSDAQLVANIPGHRAHCGSSGFYWLGWCRNPDCLDPVRSIFGVIPRKPSHEPRKNIVTATPTTVA
jgi:hypothetical protein